MPEYLFRDIDTGDEVSMVYSMSDVPPIGDEVVVSGRTLRRIASPHRASVRGFKPHTSAQVPLGDLYAPRHNSEGAAVFLREQEYHEYAAKVNNDPTRSPVKWDP